MPSFTFLELFQVREGLRGIFAIVCVGLLNTLVDNLYYLVSVAKRWPGDRLGCRLGCSDFHKFWGYAFHIEFCPLILNLQLDPTVGFSAILCKLGITGITATVFRHLDSLKRLKAGSLVGNSIVPWVVNTRVFDQMIKVKAELGNWDKIF